MLHFLAALASPRQGFVGVYNAAVGVVADGHNSSAYDVGAWSPNAVENSPTQGSHAASHHPMGSETRRGGPYLRRARVDYRP